MSDARAMMVYDANKRSLLVAYLLWWFFGAFGGHRFYLRRTGSAIAMLVITVLSIPLMFVLIGLFTIWITAIWVLVDAFLIPGLVRELNTKLVDQLQPAHA